LRLALAGLAALLAGCSSGTVVVTTPTATATVRPATATPPPTAPPAVVSDTKFTCPATVSGSQKLFADADTSLKFSFPASLTEEQCERIVLSDGSQSLAVGNLFHIWVAPRAAGQTIQQWVSQQTDQYEVVALTPLTVAHAESAASVKADPAATPGPRPFDAEPFAQAQAIVGGTAHFYTVFGLIALINTTDSTAGGPDTMNAIIASFDVP
jgi:hypothetical protein